MSAAGRARSHAPVLLLVALLSTFTGASSVAADVVRLVPPRCPFGPPQALADLLPGVAESAFPAKKKAWEQSLGGEAAARPHVRARLAGWPQRWLIPRAELPETDTKLARRLAQDTWRGLDAFTDRENGLPVDTVQLEGTAKAPPDGRIGDYASGTTIGLQLVSIVAAAELDLITRVQAIARATKILASVQRLETYEGFLYNFYDTTSLERTSNFVSFLDASWLTVGLIVTRAALPEVRDVCSALIAQTNYRFFLDAATQDVSHGYYVDPGVRSPYHYGMLYTEARLGILVAIGKGDLPRRQWFAMARTYPPECEGQTQVPKGTRRKVVQGFGFSAGYYEWADVRFVPSWGGSMFEALMPTLVLDEAHYAPKSLGPNDLAHAVVQRRYARETLAYPVWGLSPSATPRGEGYGEYGAAVLGAKGYGAGAVTPHAAALALGPTPVEAMTGLRRLATDYDIYGDFGFYDSVDPVTGTVVHKYLALDQAMLFIALANHLEDHCIQKYFASDPIVQSVLPMIGEESFFD